MASFVYNEAALQLSVGGSITWTTATLKARLVASSVTPDKDDTAMTGYTQIGGADKTLTTATRTKDTTNDRIVYDADDPAAWSAVAAGSTIGWIVIFKFISNDAGSIPICCIDVTDLPTNGSDVSAVFDAAGIFYLQQ